jgi:hypothetical protein
MLSCEIWGRVLWTHSSWNPVLIKQYIYIILCIYIYYKSVLLVTSRFSYLWTNANTVDEPTRLTQKVLRSGHITNGCKVAQPQIISARESDGFPRLNEDQVAMASPKPREKQLYNQPPYTQKSDRQFTLLTNKLQSKRCRSELYSFWSIRWSTIQKFLIYIYWSTVI